MSSSTGRAGQETLAGGGGAPERDAIPAPRRRAGNALATASFVTGAAGVTLVTVVPAVVLGILGLRQARRRGRRARGSGVARCFLGIALAVMWAVTWAGAGVVLWPHLARAVDPGCAAYKGGAMTAYKRVIGDLNAGHSRAVLTRDASRAIRLLGVASVRSHSAATSGALGRLSAQLRTLLSDIQTGAVVPDSVLVTLNRDAARADAVCGTLRV